MATSTPPSTQTLQFGAFTGTTTPLGGWQAFFIGDGDSFTADTQGFTKPLVVYWESNMTAQQIAGGEADSFLKNWAAQMAQYKQPIIFDVLDEMNGSWNPYYGNPAEYIAAYRHVHSFFSAANVKFAYDPNVAFSGVPVGTFTSYYPGNSYVDLVALDGFDFGGQTFGQVFSTSLAAMQTDFPTKPLWILSTGSVDNPPAFISALKTAAATYGLAGVIWFDFQQFQIPNSTLQTL